MTQTDTEFRPATPEDRLRLEALQVAPNQVGRVAPNAITFQQARDEPGSEIFGIWHSGDPVGLVATVDMSHPNAKLDAGDDPDGIYLWRLMICAKHQGHGHGLAALHFVVALARSRLRGRVVLSAVPGEDGAVPFYERFGFRRTGRIIDGEVELARPIAANHHGQKGSNPQGNR